ncbi:ABC transporter permease [uncultured Bifidobacterium sp.]|uniref:ABC transporter permease n=1 Tax=uncultured Bifidobacterium sp. TaxID=165187 RepID=UPI0026130634|nr:ABC transporter permease [uncultured Bifidobacterium sp.]
MKALIIKEFRELMRDKRTVAMLIAMPILLLFIFGYAANFSVDRISVAVIGDGAQSVSEKVKGFDAAKDGMDIVTVDPTQHGEKDATSLLRDRKVDAVIVVREDQQDQGKDLLSNRTKVYLDGSGLFAAQSAKRIFLQLNAEEAKDQIAATRSQAMESRKAAAQQEKQGLQDYLRQMQNYQSQAQAAATQGQPAPPMPAPPQLDPVQVPEADLPDPASATETGEDNVTVLFNPDLKTSFVMIPGLIGLIMTLIGTMITSIGLVREREQGTLEQLAVMPLKPGAVIIGKIAPYLLLALIDMAIITLIGMAVFDLPFRGDVWVFLLGTLLFLFVVLGLGIFISTVSQNSGQAVQMAMMLVMPQMLLSGIIFPLESMAVSVRWIGYLLPLTWFNELAQGTMLRGASWGSLWLPLVILAGEAAVIFSAATLRLRNVLTHGGAR